MINRLHALLNRPENGWDPVSPQHVENYSQAVGADEAVLDLIESYIGGYSGKRLLDLGAGPGHYTVAFAKRGADAFWYDVSRRYLRVAMQHAKESNISLSYTVGYLDDASSKLNTKFDLVFCNICFYYGWSDVGLANVIYDLISPGGVGYIDTNNTEWPVRCSSAFVRLQTMLNSTLRLKIGHPFPPKGRIEELFRRKGATILSSDYSRIGNDLIIIRKSGESDGG